MKCLLYSAIISLSVGKNWQIESGGNVKRLEELIFDQNNLVKYMNNSKTREERFFYKREIDVIEEHINNLRRQLNLD